MLLKNTEKPLTEDRKNYGLFSNHETEIFPTNNNKRYNGKEKKEGYI